MSTRNEQPITDAADLISTEEAAKIIGVSVRAVRDRLASGELPYVRVHSNLVLIPRKAAEAAPKGPKPRGPRQDPNSIRGRRAARRAAAPPTTDPAP